MSTRVGIVGTGGIAAVHADNLARMADAEMVAVTDIDETRSRAFADTWGGRVDPSLEAMLERALTAVPRAIERGGVRELRVVARADDFDAAVQFYRDVVGLPERAAYQGEGDARVVILEAGRATLELANAAQVAMIDAVETDGDAPSEHIRIALEVDDADAATDALVEGGAHLEAAPRVTPWGSRNSRLRAPADLQLTLFQEGAAD